jgi:zinc and cadmium transporter
MILTALQWILLMTFIDGLLALAGVFSFFISKKFLDKILLILVSFATGALLGGALFHLIPESLNELSIPAIGILMAIGFILFFFVEKMLHWHYCKDEKCKEHEKPFTYLLLSGSAIHNFLDGLIIASSFLISIPLGIITSLLIIAHELPHEIGNFGVLVYGGMTKGKAIISNFLIQLTAIIGGLCGYYFLELSNNAVYLLPFAAGGFLYITIFNLIPEVFEEKSKLKTILNIIAIILGLLLLLSAKILAG